MDVKHEEERKKIELTKWHEIKTQEREVKRHSFHAPLTKNGINSIVGNALKKHASWYYQLRVGHGAVGPFLARQNRSDRNT